MIITISEKELPFMMAGELSNDTKLNVVASLCRTFPKNLLGYREDPQGRVTAITPEGRVFCFSKDQIEAAYSRLSKRTACRHSGG